MAKYTIDPDFFKLAVEALAEEDEARIADQDKKMNELRKQRDQRVSELTNLRQLRYKNIITDDSYFLEESENLENQIKAREKAIAKAEVASRDWRQVANDVFMFAKYAKEDFDSDDLERKQYVIKTLGGKLELKARTLVFTPSKYLIPIQKAVSQTKEAKETARMRFTGVRRPQTHLNFNVVHPARFELTTPGTGNQCSTPLSYGCKI